MSRTRLACRSRRPHVARPPLRLPADSGGPIRVLGPSPRVGAPRRRRRRRAVTRRRRRRDRSRDRCATRASRSASASVLVAVARRRRGRLVPDRRGAAAPRRPSRRVGAATTAPRVATRRPGATPRRDRQPTTTATAAAARIVVDVAGAVRRPGVVELAGGRPGHRRDRGAPAARLPDADLDRLNLAAKVADGAARPGAAGRRPAGRPIPAAAARRGRPATRAPTAGRSNLNTATQRAARGAARASGPRSPAAIVAERERRGGVPIGQRARATSAASARQRFADLRDLVTV